VGQFYHPKLVWNHLGLLPSLPLRQRRSGLAEVIKYGVIADTVLFGFLETHVRACLDMAPHAVRVMVERSCRIKARVVARDERETGTLRAQLNFGHTLGHALEAATGYRTFTHGEAIAIGMCAASEISVEAGQAKPEAMERIVKLIRAAGLPTVSRRVPLAKVRKALRYDKKFIHGRPRWVVLKRLGQVAVSEAVPEAVILRVLRKYVQ
jgi:3-dehydroquinate synthase